MKKEDKPKIIETFRKIGDWELAQLKHDIPSAHNGIVCVHKYRITIEKIEEPPDVIGQRIQGLWDFCDNHHHYNPLQAAAKKIGWKLQGRAGRKYKRERR